MPKHCCRADYVGLDVGDGLEDGLPLAYGDGVGVGGFAGPTVTIDPAAFAAILTFCPFAPGPKSIDF